MRSAVVGVTILLLGLAPEPARAQGQGADVFDLQVEDLAQVVFTSSRREQEASMAAAKVYVITQAMIREGGAFALDQVLRQVPGFQVRTWLWGFTNTSVRGMLGGSPINERMLWLVDGVAINDVRDAGIWTDLAVFPIDMISRIEVMPGPHSSIYGDNAFQGVVNIITKRPEEVNEQGECGFAYGRHNTMISTVSMPVHTGGATSLLSVNHTTTDEHELVSRHSGKDVWWIRGKTILGSAQANYGGRSLIMKYPSIFASPYDKYSRYTGEMFVNMKLTSDLAEALQLYIQPSYHHWRDMFFDFGDVPGLQYKQDSYRLSNLVQLNAAVRGRDHLSLGVMARRDVYQGNDFRPSKRDLSMNKLEVNGEYEANPIDRLTVTLGASTRWGDNFSKNQSDLHPRAALLVKLTEDLRLRGIYATAYRQPSWWHRFIQMVDAQGNPDLFAEELRGVEVGLDYDLPRGSVSANYFSQKVSDGIMEIYDPSLADSAYYQYGIFGKFTPIQSKGDFTIRGLDCCATTEIIPHLASLDAVYSYLDSQGPDGLPTPYDAKHKISVSGHLTPVRRLSIGYGLHYVGETVDAELEFAPVNPADPSLGTIGRRPVPSYVIHEIAANYRFANRLGVKLSVWDVGNDVYEQYLGSQQQGRQWQISVRCSN
jgi:iron complex outermembrane receptor protein